MVVKSEVTDGEFQREGWERGLISLSKPNSYLVTRMGGREKVTVEIFKHQYRKPVPSGDDKLLNWGERASLRRTLQRNDGVILQLSQEVKPGVRKEPNVISWCLSSDFHKALSSIPATV